MSALDELIGKYAYKKLGFFAGLIGVIEKNNNGISPYKLVFKSAGAVGFLNEKDIVVVEDLEEQSKKEGCN